LVAADYNKSCGGRPEDNSNQPQVSIPNIHASMALPILRDGRAPVSRRRNSLDEWFGELRDIGQPISAKTALLDGELVTIDRERGALCIGCSGRVFEMSQFEKRQR